MNPTLYWAFLREKLTSPLRLILVFIFLVPPLFLALIQGSAAHVPSGVLGAIFAWIVGAGIIGLDTSSGVLQLLFARPIRRSEYVLTRWLALGTAAFALQLVETLIVLGILIFRGAPPDGGDLVNCLVASLTIAFGAAAVLTFFSSLAPSIADVGMVIVLYQVVSFGSLIAMAKKWEWLGAASNELMHYLMPGIAVTDMLAGSHVYFAPLVRWLFYVSLSLGLAIVMVNRKELSYAGR